MSMGRMELEPNSECDRAPIGQIAVQCPQEMHSMSSTTLGGALLSGCSSFICMQASTQSPHFRQTSRSIAITHPVDTSLSFCPLLPAEVALDYPCILLIFSASFSTLADRPLSASL
jgi:hypothetical protein